MSYDLNFWKYKKGEYSDNQEVYEKACCKGEELDILEELPIQEIIKRIRSVFKDWNQLDDFSYENDSENRGAFSFAVTSQTVSFDCYSMSGDDMNLFIDIMSEFECPLYDPQVSVRFDGKN